MQELRLPIYWAAQQIVKKIGGRDPSVLYTHPETCRPAELAADNSLTQLGVMTLSDYDSYMRSQPRYFDFDKSGKDIIVYTGRRVGGTTLAESLTNLLPQSQLIGRYTQRQRFRGLKIETFIVDFAGVTLGNLQGLQDSHPEANFVMVESGLPTVRPATLAALAIPTFHIADCITPELMTSLVLKYPEEHQVTVYGPPAQVKKPVVSQTPSWIFDMVKFADKTLHSHGFDLETVLREVRR